MDLDENFKAVIDELNKNLEQLEQRRQDFQSQKQRASEIKAELEKINGELAYCEIKENYKYYQEKLQNKKNLENKNKHNDERLSCIENKIARLNAQKEQINIAQDKINRYLKYIFFKEGRLELSEPNEQKQYTLRSNGSSVKAQDVSTGERNAIALSYFFTEIFSWENEADFYTRPKFIVIDDPVSSFDFENKVGIMSFLNYQIKNVINGCENSKILILTHDLMSAFDIQKIGISLFKKYKHFSNLELKNKILEPFKEYSEYEALISEIYDYAYNLSQVSSINIGNAMRKVLEAFGTFNYQSGIDGIATDGIIVSKLSKEQQDYFQNLMYRLVLHGDSHLEDKTKIIDFFSYISEVEKQRTAQDILSLLCLLNEAHLRKYLKDDNKINHIKNNWVTQCVL